MSKLYPAVALTVPALLQSALLQSKGTEAGVYTRVGAHAQVWGVHKGLGHIPRLEVYMQVHGVNEDTDVPGRWGQQLYMLAWEVYRLMGRLEVYM